LNPLLLAKNVTPSILLLLGLMENVVTLYLIRLLLFC